MTKEDVTALFKGANSAVEIRFDGGNPRSEFHVVITDRENGRRVFELVTGKRLSDVWEDHSLNGNEVVYGVELLITGGDVPWNNNQEKCEEKCEVAILLQNIDDGDIYALDTFPCDLTPIFRIMEGEV